MSSSSLRKFLTLGFTRWECALALIVIGVHLAVFSYAGSPVPYYDQWIMEFNDTLMSIATGNGFSVLIFRHNGHLLATTKMLTVFGYFINGYWDVSFLVICSAGIRALTAAWTFQLVAQSSRLGTKTLLWLLCAIVFAAPYSGFNFLNGMQVCFYLTDLALLWSLRATTNWATPVTSGLALIGGTLFGIVSLASAVAIPACTLAAHFFLRKARPGFWPAWTISAVVVLGFILAGRNPEAVSVRDPHSFGEVVHFWLRIISWPVNLPVVGVLTALLGAFALIIASIRDRSRTAANAIILGLGVYAIVNAAFISINRAPSEWHMRHWDTIALLPLALLALGLRLADLNIFKRSVLLLTAVITLAYVFCGGNLIRTVSWPYIEAAHKNRSAAIDHYRALFLKQDLRAECESINTFLEMRNYSFFDDPIGRFSLHPLVAQNMVVLSPWPLSMLPPEIISSQRPSKFSWFTGKLIAYGWLLSLLGIGLVALTMHREFFLRPNTTANTTKLPSDFVSP